jgi:hypothetical protein
MCLDIDKNNKKEEKQGRKQGRINKFHNFER